MTRAILPVLAGFIGESQRPASKVSPDEITRKLRLDYLYSQKDLNQKALDGAQTLFEHFQRQDFSLDTFMNDSLNLIRRRLWIREVTVALLDRRDNLFRYKHLHIPEKQDRSSTHACGLKEEAAIGAPE